MKPVAIFDVDGTIFRSSLTIELLKKLVSRGIFPETIVGKVKKSEQKWLNRKGHYEEYVHEVVKAYQRAIVGKRKRDIIAASREVISEQKFRTYRYTRKLLETLRKKYFTIGISGSPLEVLKEYNKVLKFDKLYGWEFGVDEKGRYTAVVLHVPVQYKKELVVRYIHRHSISMRGSIGVGDTESDAGFLELVDQPIVFNPNLALAKIARRKNWKMVIERKDLIVELKPNKVKYSKA